MAPPEAIAPNLERIAPDIFMCFGPPCGGKSTALDILKKEAERNSKKAFIINDIEYLSEMYNEEKNRYQAAREKRENFKENADEFDEDPSLSEEEYNRWLKGEETIRQSRFRPANPEKPEQGFDVKREPKEVFEGVLKEAAYRTLAEVMKQKRKGAYDKYLVELARGTTEEYTDILNRLRTEYKVIPEILFFHSSNYDRKARMNIRAESGGHVMSDDIFLGYYGHNLPSYEYFYFNKFIAEFSELKDHVMPYFNIGATPESLGEFRKEILKYFKDKDFVGTQKRIVLMADFITRYDLDTAANIARQFLQNGMKVTFAFHPQASNEEFIKRDIARIQDAMPASADILLLPAIRNHIQTSKALTINKMRNIATIDAEWQKESRLRIREAVANDKTAALVMVNVPITSVGPYEMEIEAAVAEAKKKGIPTVSVVTCPVPDYWRSTVLKKNDEDIWGGSPEACLENLAKGGVSVFGSPYDGRAFTDFFPWLEGYYQPCEADFTDAEDINRPSLYEKIDALIKGKDTTSQPSGEDIRFRHEPTRVRVRKEWDVDKSATCVVLDFDNTIFKTDSGDFSKGILARSYASSIRDMEILFPGLQAHDWSFSDKMQYTVPYATDEFFEEMYGNQGKISVNWEENRRILEFCNKHGLLLKDRTIGQVGESLMEAYNNESHDLEAAYDSTVKDLEILYPGLRVHNWDFKYRSKPMDNTTYYPPDQFFEEMYGKRGVIAIDLGERERILQFCAKHQIALEEKKTIGQVGEALQEAYWKEKFDQEAELVPGFLEFLRFLNENKIQVFLFSGSPESLVRYGLSQVIKKGNLNEKKAREMENLLKEIRVKGYGKGQVWERKPFETSAETYSLTAGGKACRISIGDSYASDAEIMYRNVPRNSYFIRMGDAPLPEDEVERRLEEKNTAAVVHDFNEAREAVAAMLTPRTEIPPLSK